VMYLKPSFDKSSMKEFAKAIPGYSVFNRFVRNLIFNHE